MTEISCTSKPGGALTTHKPVAAVTKDPIYQAVASKGGGGSECLLPVNEPALLASCSEDTEHIPTMNNDSPSLSSHQQQQP